MTTLDLTLGAETAGFDTETLSATEPPEARGLQRDEVRLLVAGEGPLRHVLFRDLADFLTPGDVVVVNTSATLPAAVDGRRADGAAVRVHLCRVPRGAWVVELRSAGGDRIRDAVAGEEISLAGGVSATLCEGHPDPAQVVGSRLWRARITTPEVAAYLAAFGRPIAYPYVHGQWPLDSYQTIFAREPGSAEMPSAGRPFSHRLVTDLISRGITIAPLTLHTALSSLEADEMPLPEAYRVPAETADLVSAARGRGNRVVAAGTTVTRALETAAQPDGTVVAREGWTDLVLGPDRPAYAVDGLITGWHGPGASHLLLLEAVAGAPMVTRAYESAVANRYRWHEFGDTCLLLPARH